MKNKIGFKFQRLIFLLLLSFSVFSPIFFLSRRIPLSSSLFGVKNFLEDTNGIKHGGDSVKLEAVGQEVGEVLKEPDRFVYRDRNYSSSVSVESSPNNVDKDAGVADRSLEGRNGSVNVNNTGLRLPTVSGTSERKIQKPTYEKLAMMKDQLIRAKAYLSLAPPNSNSHLVKELRLRIKEIDHIVHAARRDSELSKRALQRMSSMETVLSKANRIYSDCGAIAKKLRAMTSSTEEQVLTQRKQTTHLSQLAARTLPKGLHCLSMRLTADYFALQPGERELPNKRKFHKNDLYHYAIFSDNILACAALVSSLVSSSKGPEKIVLHVVTDALNHPAITMWFLANPPGHATIQVLRMDDFKFLPSTYISSMKQINSRDPRFSSPLNHLRFYLPEIFPMFDKIVLLDHDVVVQKDLKDLWKVDMKGKVNGAVETCGRSGSSLEMDMLINFSDPTIAKMFDVKACTWAFGMNIFDLKEWRRQNLTSVYHKWLKLGRRKQLWKAGSLPLGLITFYNQTVALDWRWHAFGLGQNLDLRREDIERAAVIHYDGIMKPWLEIAIARYRGYWNKYVDYDHPYLQRCNIHQ